MSRVEEHLRYRDFVSGGDFEKAQEYMDLHGFALKDLCDTSKKHCTTQPIYAALGAILRKGDSAVDDAMAYMQNALEEVPELADIVHHRINPLAYTALNMDRPEVAKFFIDMDPSLVNDQSFYGPDEQTSEFSDTFKMYRPSKNSPVQAATMRNHPETLKLLLEHDADPNLKNIANVTALDQYLYNCYRLPNEIGEILAEAGGELTSKGYSTPSLYYGIKYQCWSDLNRVLPEMEGLKVGNHYMRTLAKKAIAYDAVNLEAAETIFNMLDHTTSRFDFERFASKFCNSVTQNERGVCNDTMNLVLSMKDKESESIEPAGVMASNEDVLHAAADLGIEVDAI